MSIWWQLSKKEWMATQDADSVSLWELTIMGLSHYSLFLVPQQSNSWSAQMAMVKRLNPKKETHTVPLSTVDSKTFQ
jgi:hypothetical protein